MPSPSIRQVATGLDPLTEQLLLGIGGVASYQAPCKLPKKFSLMKKANRCYRRTGAGFSPDQLRAQELATRCWHTRSFYYALERLGKV